jgi:hypothetical protein
MDKARYFFGWIDFLTFDDRSRGDGHQHGIALRCSIWRTAPESGADTGA